MSHQSSDQSEKKTRKRPKNVQKYYYSGKKKRHTQKVQVVIKKRDQRILCTDFSAGTTHDFALFKDSRLTLTKDCSVLVDSGYTGLDKLHRNTKLIVRGRRNHPLTKREKERNRKRSQKRMPVEHVIGRLKNFRILSERYRNRRRRFSLRFNLIAAIYNVEKFGVWKRSIAYLGGERAIVSFINNLIISRRLVYLPAVAEIEVLSFSEWKNREVREVELFLSKSFVFMPVDRNIVQLTSRIRRTHKIKTPDATIAATALFTSTPLVTRNVRDFKKIPGLVVETL